jgi:serine phosphatase RsbU (regulator of sigma subunit)
MYSDGVTEATANRRQEFGEARLLEVLRQGRHLDASSLVSKVRQAVEEFSSGEQHDDLTLVIARGR